MEFYTEHLAESKKLLEIRAKEIFLDKEDLQFDKSMFAPVKQKSNNVILSDYLLELANERLSSFKNLSNDEILSSKYKEELVSYLRTLLRSKL